jgi:CubicO group peptidase (beta-lactamase class C family)
VPKNWFKILLLLFAVGVGLIAAFVYGLHLYVTATATPLHPDLQKVPSVAHADPPPRWSDAVAQGRQIVRESLQEQNLPGLSVAVGVAGGIVWAEGFGWADLEKQAPVAPHMRFRIGTASTVLTSAAAGLLLEKGRLKLDDEIQTWVPDFPKKEWPVTLRQLMAHTAGVRTDGGDEGPLFSQHCERPVDALPAFAERPLLFEPGTQYRYSSYGWILVSAAIEAASAEPFFTFMRTQVFEPLGMQDTIPDSATDPIPDRVTMYFPRYGADPKYGLHLMRPIDYSCYAGASAFLSTPSDLVRFGMAIDGGKLLKAATVKLIRTSEHLPSGDGTGYGLGWDLESVTLGGEQTQVVGHDGEVLGGAVASLMTVRDRELVVAVASNISYADTFALGSRIAEVFAARGTDPAPR